MRIALLSGAVKNSGDYLITERCKAILQSEFGDAAIDTYIRNNKITPEELDKINRSDCIIIGGGPCYKWDLYPESLPLVSDLSMIKPKILMIGCGWYGESSSPEEVWKYRFSESSMELLKRIHVDSDIFGCRDYYAVRVLQANGFKSGLMTGCPAWYDLTKLDSRLSKPVKVDSIGVSDPADIMHFGDQSLEICKYLKKRYPQARLNYFFHRGIKADDYTDQNTVGHINRLSAELKKLGFEIHDISYGSEGFKLYNACDIHIGHRVHAHIYNLSQRKVSVLIEEDARGAGVNEALGLWSIKAYSRKKTKFSPFLVKAYNKVFDYTVPNQYVINDLDACLDSMSNSDYLIMDQAFSHMESYFLNMQKHIRSIRTIVEGT